MMPWGISLRFVFLASTEICVISLNYAHRSATLLSETALARGRIIAPAFGRGRQQRSASIVQSPLQSSRERNSWDNLERDIDGSREDLEARREESSAAKAPAAAERQSDLDALGSLLLELKDSFSPDPEGNPVSIFSPKDIMSNVIEPEGDTMRISPNTNAPTDSDVSVNLADDGFGELDDLLGLQNGVSSDPTHEADVVYSSQAESVEEILNRNLPSAPKTPVTTSNSREESMAWLDDVLNVDSREGQAGRDTKTATAGTTAATAPAGTRTPSQATRGSTDGATISNSLEALLDEVSSSFPGSSDRSTPSRTVVPDKGEAEVPGIKGIGSRNGRGQTVGGNLDRSGDGITNTYSGLESSVLNEVSAPSSSPAAGLPIDLTESRGSTREPVVTDTAGVPEAIDDWLDDFLEGTRTSASMEASASLPTPPRKQPVSQMEDFSEHGAGMNGHSWDLWDGDSGNGWRDVDKRTGLGRSGRGDPSVERSRSNDVVGRFRRRSSAGGSDTQRGFNIRRDRRQGIGGEGGEKRGFLQEDQRWDAGSGRAEGGYGDGGWGWRDDWRDADPVEAAQKAVMADLKALGARGEWEDVIRALVGARVRGVPVNVYMYNSAISAVGKCGRYKEALSMMKQMRKDGLEPDAYTYSSAITACGKGSKATKALSLLDEMVEQYGIAPDMVCYGAAISACAEVGLPEEALNVMQRMTAAGFVPDKMAFNAVIAACGQSGEWERALDTLGEMRAAGLRPNQHSYRLAMEACGNGGRWERALQLLEDMEEDGSTPGLPAFQVALDTLKHAGQWEKALELIGEMDEVGVIPTEECFAAAIGACGEVGRWREACDAIKTMRDLNLQPTVLTYNSVLKSCVRGKNYSRALSTMTDLRKSGKRPEQETWELLVEACIVCGRWECAVEVVRDMYAEEVWYDMEAIRGRFFECPVDEFRVQALTMIALEERSAASRKRKKQSNIRMAEKRKSRHMIPSKATPPSARKKKDNPLERSNLSRRSFADSNVD